MPDVTVVPGRAEVAIKSDSAIAAALSILDLPPFEFMAKAGLPVDLAKGRAILQAGMEFDLKERVLPDDISYAVSGKLLDTSSDKLVEGRNISAPELDLRIDSEGIVISGSGRIGQVPAIVAWSQRFGKEYDRRSRAEGSIRLSQETLEEFNIAIPPQSVSGIGSARFTVDFAGDSMPGFTVLSDLNGIGVSVVELNWSKPADSIGELELSGKLGPMPDIDRLVFRAPGLSATGSLTLGADGRLSRAHLDTLQVGDWLDGTVTLIGRREATPAVLMRAGQIDLRTTQLNYGSRDAQSGLLVIALDRLIVSNNIDLTSFRGDFRSSSEGLQGNFTALVNGGPAVEGAILPTAEGSIIQILSADGGGALAAASILPNARDGEMVLMLNASGAKGVYDGSISIFGMRMIQNPVLADLLSAISIVGLIDQLNSGGIWFADINGEFQLTPEKLTLLRLSAIGPSLGISLDGTYNLRSNQMRMQGVLSPFYFLNIIGEVVSLGRGGLFGFHFDLTGTSQNTQVSVNPLSILTPGFFREVFRRAPPEPIPSQ